MKNTVFYIAFVIAFAIFALCGCKSITQKVRDVPGFEFKSWSHSDRYGVFTDSVSASGAKWTLNADGSATLVLDHYDGSAAWAGSVGPHDVIEGLVINFPPTSPQAVALQHLAAVKLDIRRNQ